MASHPMKFKIGLQFMIAMMRAYPAIFEFFEINSEKYKASLAG